MDYLTYFTKLIMIFTGVYNVTPEEKNNSVGCHHPILISVIVKLEGTACQPTLINNSLQEIF